METLQIGKTTHYVPSTWNEMRRKQLLLVLAELFQPVYAGCPIRLLSLLTGLDPDVLAQLLPLVDFLFAEDHLLTEQLLPTLTLPGRHVMESTTSWHGPPSYLRNLTFGEFMFADTSTPSTAHQPSSTCYWLYTAA